MPIEEICRKLGIANATFYRWKQKYGGLLPSEVKKLKQLEEENKRLKEQANVDVERALADAAAERKKAEEEKRPFLYRDHRPETFEVWDGKKPLRFKVPEIKAIIINLVTDC